MDKSVFNFDNPMVYHRIIRFSILFYIRFGNHKAIAGNIIIIAIPIICIPINGKLAQYISSREILGGVTPFK